MIDYPIINNRGLSNAMIKREFIQKLLQRFQQLNPLIHVVIGPRQVGKTTGIKQFLQEYQGGHHYVSADRVLNEHSSWILKQWQAAKIKGEDTLLVIDEIQKIPDWSESIKKLWDEQSDKKQRIKVILSGSSSLSLMQGMTESLAGRMEIIPVYHWDYIESEQLAGLSVDDYLRYGGYPKSYDFLQDQTRWQQYLRMSVIDSVIDKDILRYAQVKKPALFRQAFEIVCAYPAQEISYRKLLGQLQDKGNTDLVKYYLRLFEGAFLIKTLQKYSNQAFKVKSSSPKLLPLAPCFYKLFSLSEDKLPFVFECSVGAKLLQVADAIYYWREDKYEVDFVMKWRNQLIAIEVKSGKQQRMKTWRSGLDVFQQRFPEAKPVIISRDNYRQFVENPHQFFTCLCS